MGGHAKAPEGEPAAKRMEEAEAEGLTQATDTAVAETQRGPGAGDGTTEAAKRDLATREEDRETAMTVTMTAAMYPVGGTKAGGETGTVAGSG